MRLVGRWRIVEMSGWDRDAIDLVEPGFRAKPFTDADELAGQ
jgi:hypothetical protein